MVSLLTCILTRYFQKNLFRIGKSRGKIFLDSKEEGRMRFIIALLLIISNVQATTSTPSPSSITHLLPPFEALIHKAMQQKKVPGLAIAIVKDGKVVYMKGFGVRTVGRPDPVNIHTVFQIGSASKAITSVLVAILNRDKILSLDHPVDIIPNTTVRHILSHTTGIPSPGFNSLIERGTPAADVYKRIKATTPD